MAMKKILKRISLVICMLWGVAYGQTIGYLRYDSVKIYKNGGTSELILENATKGVTGGVLVNTWDGRTAFTLTPSLTGFWKTTGNAGTTAGTNFIGTTDNVDLVLKRNSVHSGRIGSSNTSFGYASLNLTATGVNNSAFGGSSLNALTTGNGNSVFGLNAGQFIDAGEYNTAIGHRALENNEIGDYNTSLGYYSGYNTGTTTANNNLFLGSYSGKYMTTEANRIFLNTLDRTDKEGDTISSPIYIAQHATAASQRLYLNSRVFAPYIPNTVTANSIYYDATTKEFSYGTAATGTVTGTGTANTGTKWTGTSSIGNASFTDDGSTFTIGIPAVGTTSHRVPLLIGGTGTTSTLTYKTTTGVGTTGADHIFQVGNNGATEAMRILNSGNVGIGISPSYRFQARGASYGEIWYDDNSNVPTFTLNRVASSGQVRFDMSYSGSAKGGMNLNSSGEIQFYASSGGYYPTFWSNGSERMQINTSGNVGIGTTSPSARLHTISTTEQLRLGYDASNYISNTVSSAGVLTISPTGASITVTKPIVLQGYTVATLPTGVTGMTAYVTDATAPTYNAALVGGGAVVVPVFYNGAAWVSH